MSIDPRDFTVDLLSAGFASGDLSPVEVTQACLDQISAQDGLLRAFTRIDPEGSLASARASEQRWRSGDSLGPLDGVPTSIKDLVMVKGWATLKGSPHIDPAELATESSPVTQSLLDAGVVLVGKTTTPESGWKGLTDSPISDITRNPWDSALTAGGSSGGAAVAAATGMAVLNVGTDGGGSIRIPAGLCGVFGIKPTQALIPLYPPGVSGLLSHLGPITRTVRDTAHMMSVIARPSPREIYPTQRDNTSWIDEIDDGIAGLRVAYSPRYGDADVDPQIAAAVERTVNLMADLGAIVERAEPNMPPTRDAFLTLWDAAIGRALTGVPESDWHKSDPGLVETHIRGMRISAQQFLDADAVRAQATLAINDLLSRYDVLVSPQLPLVAFPVGSDVADPTTQTHWVDWTPFTYPINMTRHPAATVPVGLSREGLPMALQIVGAHFADRQVLRVARTLELSQPFPRLP
ncbi:MAG: amidase [Actinomycetes bacterium]